MQEFDVVVIGSGPGGYIAAIRAAQLGLKTAIVERYKTLGGTCLNVGCIPSKAWLDSSERYHETVHSHAVHGIEVGEVKLNVEKMSARVAEVVKGITGGVAFLMKKNKITTFYGHGKFKNANEIEVLGDNPEVLKAKYFIIATGSKPSSLPNVKIDKEKIITSTEALKLKTKPKHLIVIGGGVIGVELGSVMKRLGSEVTVVDFADSLISTMDSELGKELQKVLTKDGVKFKLGFAVESVVRNGDQVVVKAKAREGSEVIEISGDLCLMSVGRVPYTSNLGLENIGIELDNRGKIPVNDHLQTKHAHIFAIGDVIKGPMLAHKAEEEGVYVAEVIMGQKPHINYNLIPGVVYTWPEVSAVGFTEEELKKNNIPYKVGKFPLAASGRAKASNESAGFVKVLAHKETDEIIGVHMIGPRTADMISEAVVAMEFRASAEDIGRISHAHPTYSESFKEACLMATANRPLNF
jgi:dihydrolipoamide dehydrogenase